MRLPRFTYLQAKLGDVIVEAEERQSDKHDGGGSPSVAVARRHGNGWF